MSTGLVANLAVALIAACVGAVLARVLRQSSVIGYIAAGVVIGPFTPGLVADPHAVEELADVGLVFLLFTIGIELSLRDLVRAGRAALLAGGVQVALTVLIGAAIGLALGWSTAGALFFGGVLAISSGAVLSKILGERGELDSEHGRLALAWSTVQDLATIVLVVLLPALATTSGNAVQDVGLALGKALLFLVVLVPLGLRFFPALFDWIATLRSREVFVLSIGAVALGTAFVSTLFGVSLALGAFVAGLLVSDSDLSHQVVAEIAPLRDILAGLFFVSVGMLIDLQYVVQHVPLVLLVLILMVVGKGVLVAGLAALTRVGARTAVLVGVAMAQCGEFSFLLARAGRDTNALTTDDFNLLLSGAAASILAAPSLHAFAGPAVRSVERRVSARALTAVPEVVEDEPRRFRAVICGYGAVGRLIGEALRRRGFDFVAIDRDPRLVRQLREEGITALLGSADNPVMLDRAGLDRARVLVVAIPEALAARQIVEYAHHAWPRLDIVARTHSEEQMADLRERGVDEVVSGEVELALEMARHTLHRFGVSRAETTQILHGLRQRGLPERSPP